jgi:hypothetical protein
MKWAFNSCQEWEAVTADNNNTVFKGMQSYEMNLKEQSCHKHGQISS